MAKFRIFKKGDLTFRRYVSNKNYCKFFVTDVNLKHDKFSIYYCDGRQYFLFLTLNYKPKKVLDYLGFCLDDMLEIERVDEFLDDVCKLVNREGNKIKATFSARLINSYDVEIL